MSLNIETGRPTVREKLISVRFTYRDIDMIIRVGDGGAPDLLYRRHPFEFFWITVLPDEPLYRETVQWLLEQRC